jgi:CubicO group peptidase (beta-lactamase class C family)
MYIRLCVGLIFSLVVGCADSGPEPLAVSGMEQMLPELVEEAEVAGLSIAVVREGEPMWTGAYGVRNAESGEPVREDTLFEAASLSKPIFAYAVMRLVARGELDLDKPLVEYLPYKRLEHDERYKEITSRLVLSHNSGLPNWGGTPLEMELAPGKRFGYSGEGYVYLQKVTQEITGLTLNELATREVFEPFGMSDSSYLWSDDFGPRMADGHRSLGEPRKRTRKPGGGDNAAYSLVTTASDYAIFLSAVLAGQGLESKTWDEVFTPRVQVVTFDTKEKADNVFWGLGWGIQKGKAGPAFFHWGDNPGYKAYTIGYCDRGTALVYFTNSDEGLSVAEAIVGELVEDSDDALAWLDEETYDAPERLARRSLARAFLNEGAEAGMRVYRETKARYPDLELERVVNSVGYTLIRKEEVGKAIEVFEINVREYPESPNAYDSLAESYMVAGKDELAIENYERSRELDPENTGVEKNIQWIRERVEARKNPVRLSERQLERFVGIYGPFQISISSDSLIAKIEWLKKDYRLVPLTEDVLDIEGLGGYRLQFIADTAGNVTKAVGISVGGRKIEGLRSP